MKLVDIEPVLNVLENRLVVVDLRTHTYLSSYPEILAHTKKIKKYNVSSLYHLSLLVYGWMPRVLRVDSSYLEKAVEALNQAIDCNTETFREIDVSNLAQCLHSVVGASKMLHFAKPDVFPIWDSKIQAFRGKRNGYNDMAKIENYFEFVGDVHGIISDSDFESFKSKFNTLFEKRLLKSDIEKYAIGNVRVVEAATFELA